jgi:hypothetical protein
LSSHPAVLIE